MDDLFELASRASHRAPNCARRRIFVRRNQSFESLKEACSVFMLFHPVGDNRTLVAQAKIGRRAGEWQSVEFLRFKIVQAAPGSQFVFAGRRTNPVRGAIRVGNLLDIAEHFPNGIWNIRPLRAHRPRPRVPVSASQQCRRGRSARCIGQREASSDQQIDRKHLQVSTRFGPGRERIEEFLKQARVILTHFRACLYVFQQRHHGASNKVIFPVAQCRAGSCCSWKHRGGAARRYA